MIIPSWGPSIGLGVAVLTIQNLHFLDWLHRNLTICTNSSWEEDCYTFYLYTSILNIEPILEHQSWSGLRFYQFRNFTLNKSFSVNIGIFGEVVFHKKIFKDKYLILTVSYESPEGTCWFFRKAESNSRSRITQLVPTDYQLVLSDWESVITNY